MSKGNKGAIVYKKVKFEEAIKQLNEIRHMSLDHTDEGDDGNPQENILNLVHGFFRQERAYDMFLGIDYSKGAGELGTNRAKYKMVRESLTHLYNKLNILINFKALGSVLFIKCCLRKMQTARELFVLEIEQGREAFVP